MARVSADGDLVAECELRDGDKLVGRMTVGPGDRDSYVQLSPLSAEVFASAVNCFRGQVRAYAIDRVAESENSGNPVVVRVVFPDAVLNAGGSFGIPTIR